MQSCNLTDEPRTRFTADAQRGGAWTPWCQVLLVDVTSCLNFDVLWKIKKDKKFLTCCSNGWLQYPEAQGASGKTHAVKVSKVTGSKVTGKEGSQVTLWIWFCEGSKGDGQTNNSKNKNNNSMHAFFLLPWYSTSTVQYSTITVWYSTAQYRSDP